MLRELDTSDVREVHGQQSAGVQRGSSRPGTPVGKGAYRTEATVRIRLEKSRLEHSTELNLQRTFGPTTKWLGTCWYLLVDLSDQKTVPR